jgi:TCP-1/cpn60 chaperonin family
MTNAAPNASATKPETSAETRQTVLKEIGRSGVRRKKEPRPSRGAVSASLLPRQNSMLRAVEAPNGRVRLQHHGARQIAINAGEDGSIIVGKILEKDQYSFGFDAQSGEYVNMISKGIIDPTKVVRAALQGAASVAGLLITTEAMVAELPKKQGPAMPAGGGMGGMDF